MAYTNPLSLRYLTKLGDQIVAKSQNPYDRHHLGKLVLKQLRDHPDDINQIDGSTDGRETNSSMLERSTATARAISSQGLKIGDVVLLMSPNNLDVSVPFLACLYIGVVPMAVDSDLSDKEILKKYLEIADPKIVFCVRGKAEFMKNTALELGMDIMVVTLGKEEVRGYESLKQFIAKFRNKEQSDTFEATSFDTSSTVALMHFSSGTTGSPKAVIHTHRSYLRNIPYPWCQYKNFPRPTTMAFLVSPLQWMTATYTILLGAIFVFQRVQFSEEYSKDLAYRIINKYKPSWCVMSTNMALLWMQYPDRLSCDFSCFQTVMIGGNAVALDVIETFRSVVSGTVANAYGMTEAGSFVFLPCSDGPVGSSGKALPNIEYKLLDIKTGVEAETDQPGELHIRGDFLFSGYYKDEDGTKAAFSPGGWYKTGDIMYRDHQGYYFFVDRVKMLMKYKTFFISPTELEDVIRQHAGVVDVAVCGFLQPGEGDLPTACVVRKTHHNNQQDHVTAQHIKDLVKEKLEDEKHLRGGVIFLEKIPLTATSKVDRVRLKEMVHTLTRE